MKLRGVLSRQNLVNGEAYIKPVQKFLSECYRILPSLATLVDGSDMDNG